MKSICLLIATYLSVVSSFSIHAQTLYNGVGHIPAAYQERWNKAGLLRDMRTVEPKKVINVAAMPGSTDEFLNMKELHRLHISGSAKIFFETH